MVVPDYPLYGVMCVQRKACASATSWFDSKLKNWCVSVCFMYILTFKFPSGCSVVRVSNKASVLFSSILFHMLLPCFVWVSFAERNHQLWGCASAVLWAFRLISSIWSTIGLGFIGAETNYRIAHILGNLLMISYGFDFYFSDIIVVCAV